MDYARCTRCGREWRKPADYCPRCGVQLAVTAEPLASSYFEDTDKTDAEPLFAEPITTNDRSDITGPPLSLAALLLILSLFVFLLAWLAIG